MLSSPSIETRKKNFTEFEKSFLKTCVSKLNDIIENKKTDGRTIQLKNEAWEKVTVDFNNSPRINEKATVKQLHRLWNNIKQRQRVELAREKLQRTGASRGSSMEHIDQIVVPNLFVEVDNGIDCDNSMSTTTSFKQEIVDEDSIEVTAPAVSITPKSELDVVASTVKRMRYSSSSSNDSSASLKRSLMEAEANDRRKRLKVLMEFDRELHQERLLLERAKLKEAETRAKIAMLELQKLQWELDIDA